MLNDIAQFLVWLPVIIIALTFHEYAHGLVAYHLGDNTARDLGRLTINPLPHLDPVGFLIMIFPPHFGWAKPVPVNPWGFDRVSPRTGMMLVAAAGPLMNILLAALSLFIIRLLSPMAQNNNVAVLMTFLTYLFQINVVLAAFNLIPLPPLDGSRVLAGFLPERGGEIMDFLERYGFIILLLLILSPALDMVLGPLINIIRNLLVRIIL